MVKGFLNFLKGEAAKDGSSLKLIDIADNSFLRGFGPYITRPGFFAIPVSKLAFSVNVIKGYDHELGDMIKVHLRGNNLKKFFPEATPSSLWDCRGYLSSRMSEGSARDYSVIYLHIGFKLVGTEKTITYAYTHNLDDGQKSLECYFVNASRSYEAHHIFKMKL